MLIVLAVTSLSPCVFFVQMEAQPGPGVQSKETRVRRHDLVLLCVSACQLIGDFTRLFSLQSAAEGVGSSGVDWPCRLACRVRQLSPLICAMD